MDESRFTTLLISVSIYNTHNLSEFHFNLTARLATLRRVVALVLSYGKVQFTMFKITMCLH